MESTDQTAVQIVDCGYNPRGPGSTKEVAVNCGYNPPPSTKAATKADYLSSGAGVFPPEKVVNTGFDPAPLAMPHVVQVGYTPPSSAEERKAALAESASRAKAVADAHMQKVESAAPAPTVEALLLRLIEATDRNTEILQALLQRQPASKR